MQFPFPLFTGPSTGKLKALPSNRAITLIILINSWPGTRPLNLLIAFRFVHLHGTELYAVYSEGRRHHNHCRYPNRWVHQGPRAVIVYVRRKAIQVNPRAVAGCCCYSVSRVEYFGRVKVWQGAQPTCWRALNSNGRWRNPLKWLARITFARDMDRAVVFTGTGGGW